MNKIQICLILFFTLLLFQMVLGDVLAESEGERLTDLARQDTAQLAKAVWKEFFSADARFRQESIFKAGSPSRYRYRIRFRMGGNFPVHPKVNFGFRVVTGAPHDPTTGNVDLDDYFSKKWFNLDRLFFRYSPSAWVTLTVGKFPNPFEHIELIFHNDVQFEGAAQQFRVNDFGFIGQTQLNLGQFVLDEVKDGPDTNLFAGQLFVKGFYLGGLSFGATLYEYRNEHNIAQAVEDGRLWGGDTNARIGVGTRVSAYPFGFRIIEGLAKYEFGSESVPLWVLGAYAQNVVADFNDKAYWVEVGAGPISHLHKLKALYHYVWVEQESMISNYNNADIFNPNAYGHELKLVLPIEQNISVEALYFLAKNIIVSGDNPYQHKTRLQIKAKF